MNRTNKIAWFVFGFLAVGIGLYPLIYVFADGEMGLLLSKSKELLANKIWNTGFYGHISFGGLALGIGWVQFSRRFRNSNLARHRLIGKIYVIAVLISGFCGGFIAFYATGGFIAKLGFFFLAVVWLFFTLSAYFAIRKGDIEKHKVFMIYSYAACFGAVTLRIWLPLLILIIGSFEPAYRIVAWLAWVPNLVFAYFWVRRKGLIIG
ncbi:DUF2306 domain-containing protein [Maribacter cobaltidurans]|uniref:Uncharacterized protein n=1 Tax=Maribacter cobaltidurans TaxID=1178778 RepID=A0A223V1U6_9FLAO|nr:DUF2306 domain-containing protein [Maribacter cobaltidurans]ASV29332.1 hypothetical protein CJ263_03355 [Maribacter cobaltidurans]GGD69919.1 hypothetical protein GCM10011412_04380 [Maribacter cobaltidurans]